MRKNKKEGIMVQVYISPLEDLSLESMQTLPLKVEFGNIYALSSLACSREKGRLAEK